MSRMYNWDHIAYLLSLEEKLRGHSFMKPVHDEIMAELRAHAAGERPPHPEPVFGESQATPEPVEETAHEEPEEEAIPHEEEEHQHLEEEPNHAA